MNNLDEEILKEYDYEDLVKIQKWLEKYIVPVKNNEIKWQVLNHRELQKFFNDNYYDDEYNDYVYWLDCGDKMPLGMYFLSYLTKDRGNKYFIGTIPNKLGKQTIIASICYLDSLNIGDYYQPVTGVEGIEINYFYRGEGLLKEMMNEFAKNIDKEQCILVTAETPLGKKHQVMKHLKKALSENNFNNDIRFEDEIDDAYLEKITRK